PPTPSLVPYTTLFRSAGVLLVPQAHAGAIASAGHREEVEDDLLAPQVGQVHSRADRVRQGEIRGRVTDLEFCHCRPSIESVGVRSEEHTSELQSRFDL